MTGDKSEAVEIELENNMEEDYKGLPILKLEVRKPIN